MENKEATHVLVPIEWIDKLIIELDRIPTDYYVGKVAMLEQIKSRHQHTSDQQTQINELKEAASLLLEAERTPVKYVDCKTYEKIQRAKIILQKHDIK